MKYFPRQDYPAWQKREEDFKREFGLTPKTKWPDAGLESKTIDGVKVWVRARSDRFAIRTRCECPTCGRDVAASRLNQHAKVHR
jgi:hypothetical protein